MKKARIILSLIMVAGVVSASAQSTPPKFHRNHLYAKVELNSGNIYPFAVWSILSGVLNSSTNYNLFEGGYAYDYYAGNCHTKYNSPIGFTARSLFNHLQPGIKLGYYSDYFSSPVNWGLVATAGYKLNQFGIKDGDLVQHQNVQRLQLGASLLLAFGKNGGWSQVLLELGAKYNIATAYKGFGINDSKALNNGVTSHYALKFGGEGWLQNVGVFVDIDHYNLFNQTFEHSGALPFRDSKLKDMTFGLSLTVTPSQVGKRQRF